MLATSTATMLTGAMIITIQMVNAWLAGTVPTTSPSYTAPKRLSVSTLAAGKQTPTQILHLPASIWTVTHLITYLRKVPKVTTPTLAYKSISPPKLAHPQLSKPVKRWNFRKANWDHYSNLTNKLAKSIPPPESHNIDQVYQCFCKVISTAAKKCIPRGRRSNHIPCWDAECEDLYQHFLQSQKGRDSDRAATALLKGSKGSGEIAGQRPSATLTFRNSVGWHEIL